MDLTKTVHRSPQLLRVNDRRTAVIFGLLMGTRAMSTAADRAPVARETLIAQKTDAAIVSEST